MKIIVFGATGTTGSEKDITPEITVADVADFMLKQLTDETYVRATPGLSN